jgi:hypothetical protein
VQKSSSWPLLRCQQSPTLEMCARSPHLVSRRSPQSKLPAYYRESTHVELNIYRFSRHFFAFFRIALHRLMRVRKIISAIHLCRLRLGNRIEFGTKRSQVQILSARFAINHFRRKHF